MRAKNTSKAQVNLNMPNGVRVTINPDESVDLLPSQIATVRKFAASMGIVLEEAAASKVEAKVEPEPKVEPKVEAEAETEGSSSASRRRRRGK